MKIKKSRCVFLNKKQLVEQIKDYLTLEFADVNFLAYAQSEIHLVELYQDIIPNTFKKFIRMDIVGTDRPVLEIYQYDSVKKIWNIILSDIYSLMDNPLHTFINNFDFNHTLIHIDNFGHFLENHQRLFNSDIETFPSSCRCIFSIRYEKNDDDIEVENPVKWGDYMHFYLSERA